MTITKRQAQTVVLGLSYVGLAHFAVGLYHTFRLVVLSDARATYFWFVLPYVGIAAIFIVAVLVGHMGRLRASAATLALGLLVSIAACAYDFQNHRYQMSGTGYGPTYTIWWWYYEPYWQGYEPGNL